MEFGFCGKYGKVILKLVHLIFLILGIGFAVIGVVMRVTGTTFDNIEVIALFNKIVFHGNMRFGNVISHISYLTLALGGFIMIFAVISFFCCIRHPNKCLLVTYAVFILLIFVVQSVTVGMWFTMKFKIEYQVQSHLRNFLLDYEGVTSTKDTSKAWDLLFLQLECCGVDAISSSSNSDEFSGSSWWNNFRSSVLDKVPGSCCSRATESNYKSYSDTNCQRTLTVHNKQGCHEAIKEWLFPYYTSAVVLGSILIFIEILAFIYAFVACRTLIKKDFISLDLEK